MQYVLETAEISDLTAIVGIYNSTIENRCATADLKPVSVQSRKAWFEKHTGNRPLYVLKNQANEVAAWGSFSDYYPRDAYHISAEISIYVHPDMRGKGLGKYVLQQMLERAPALGICNVIAVIFGHNHASIQLFETFGFEKWGHLPNVCDLENRLADIEILGKKLQ